MYQTYFHKSVRVSDILPGETGMIHLLNQCPGIFVSCLVFHVTFISIKRLKKQKDRQLLC